MPLNPQTSGSCPASFYCFIPQILDCHLLLNELFASLLIFFQERSRVLLFHRSSHPLGLNMILQLARFVEFNKIKRPNIARTSQSEELKSCLKKRGHPIRLIAAQVCRQRIHNRLHHRHNCARDIRYNRQRSHCRLLRQVLVLTRIVAYKGFEMLLSLTVIFDSDVVKQGPERSAVTCRYNDFRAPPIFGAELPFCSQFSCCVLRRLVGFGKASLPQGVLLPRTLSSPCSHSFTCI